MDNYQFLKQLKLQSETSLFVCYEHEYKDKPGVDFYRGCIELAPHSFLAFASAYLKERFDLQPFHRLIAELFEYSAKLDSDVKRFIISAPPRAGKSMLTQLYVSWLCGLNPLTAHIFCSYGQRLSSKFMSGVALIMQSVEYQECFPAFPGFATGSNTLFKTGGSIFGTSVGGAITGMSAGTLDILSQLSPGIAVMDDPLKNGESKAEIEALEPYYVDEFNTRRTGNWRQALIATRFAVNDLHAVVLNLDGIWDSESNPSGWVYCNLPALCLEPETDILNRKYNESIWPNHPTLNTPELLKLAAKNKWRFTTVYQGLPAVKDGTLVLRSTIGYPKTILLAEIKNIILAIDSASGSTAQCDNTSLTMGAIYNNMPCILEQISGNWTIIELRIKIAELINKWKPEKIGIENASTGLVLIPEMISNHNNCNLTKIAIDKLSPQLMGSKIRRLQAVEELLAITIFSNTWQSFEYEEFIKEILAFPNGTKDDRVDSFIWALIMLKELMPKNSASFDIINLEEVFDECMIF